MTEAERWARVREIFESALGLHPNARVAFLDAECGTDATLRAEVEGLLEAATDDTFLREPRAGLAARVLDGAGRDPSGARIGPFRLVERLGQGGMGQVWVAEREGGDFQQRVAIKLVRGTFATDDLLQRFERERAILASLNHPNIAHLLDGGLSEYGPYLAMELVVGGASILDYSDAKTLTVQERVELFATVCDAVHFAHQHLVVHRDLKPSNVLVTPEGRVKLLDFGIAGLLDDGVTQGEALTRTGLLLMTPEYASPEQVRGVGASTASDVYALGVMLFELLTGQRPYDLRGLSPASIERRLASEVFARPSDVVEHRGVAPVGGTETAPEAVGLARSIRPDRLRRALRGDLDTIVQRAMHQDPARRYDSAAAFAADLRLHLAAKPVLARPDTVGYRLSTFGRRNRGGLVAAALVTAAVAVGAVATGVQTKRGDTRFDETRGLANSLLSELHEALEDVPGATPVRAMLVTQALTYLDDLSSDPRSDPDLLLDVADAYDQIGEIQGDPTSTNLGDLAAARTSYEQAKHIRETVWTVDTTHARTRRALAKSYRNLGVVTAFEGDLQESLRLARAGLELISPLERQRSAGDDVTIVSGRLRSLVGTNLVANGEWETGPEVLDTAVAYLEEAVAERAGDVRLTTDLWDAYNGQLNVLWYSTRPALGLELLESKACPLLEQLVSENPNRALAVYSLQQCVDSRGLMLEQLRRPEEAEVNYRRALEMAESLLALDPSNEAAHEAVSSSSLSLGRLLFQQKRPTEGRVALERTAEIRAELKANNPSNERWTYLLGSVQREICRGLVETGSAALGLPTCLEAVANHAQAAGNGPGVITEVTLAFALGQTARTYRALAVEASSVAEKQRLTELAIAHYERSVASYERVGDLGEDAAWEIHPDTIRFELAQLRGPGVPVS